MHHENKIVSITSCSAEKTMAPKVVVKNTVFESLEEFSKFWSNKITTVSERLSARSQYTGRGFRHVCSRTMSDPLFVVSAGLGLISADNKIPSYELTISPGSEGSIHNFLDCEFDATDWWEKLKLLNWGNLTFSDLAKNCDFVLMSLSEPYLKMIINDIAHISNKIVLFSGNNTVTRKIKSLGGQVPYTEKFDGPQCPIPGAKIDFAQRCHADFLDRLKELGTVEKVFASIKKDMNEWDVPVKHNNKPLSDEEMRLLITEYKPQFSSIGAMLKFFRHDRKVACEEKRFASLYRSVSEGVM